MEFVPFLIVPIILVGVGLVFLTMVAFFMLALILFYFTGSKPGAGVITNFMRVGTRFYLHSWILVSILLKALGLSFLIKFVFGALFPLFVYGNRGKGGQIDLQLGLALFLFAIVILAIHWFLARSIETEREQRGSFLTKLFNMIGLVLVSIVLFPNLFTLAIEFLNLFTNPSVMPGGTLATVLGFLPAWGLFLGRSIWLISNEDNA